MPRIELTPEKRRNLIMEADSDGSPTQLAKIYNVSRSRVYALLDEARANAKQKREDAEQELAFRRWMEERHPEC